MTRSGERRRFKVDKAYLIWQSVFFQMQILEFVTVCNFLHVTGIGSGSNNDADLAGVFFKCTGHQRTNRVVQYCHHINVNILQCWTWAIPEK